MRMSSVLIGVWFVIAMIAVAAGLLRRMTIPPPALILGLAALTVCVVLLTRARTWLQTVDLRVLLLPHLVRFVGVVFLVLVGRGVLARDFVPIGWGDTIAAIGAVALLLMRPRLSTRAGWWSVFLWNCVGLADMIVLIATGIRVGSATPEKFALFLQLPFGLLPTFFVPLIIASHVFLFVRLFTSAGTAGSTMLVLQTILLPLALGEGGSFTSTPLSGHATTNIETIQRFVDRKIEMTQVSAGVVTVTV